MCWCSGILCWLACCDEVKNIYAEWKRTAENGEWVGIERVGTRYESLKLDRFWDWGPHPTSLSLSPEKNDYRYFHRSPIIKNRCHGLESPHLFTVTRTCFQSFWGQQPIVNQSAFRSQLLFTLQCGGWWKPKVKGTQRSQSARYLHRCESISYLCNNPVIRRKPFPPLELYGVQSSAGPDHSSSTIDQRRSDGKERKKKWGKRERDGCVVEPKNPGQPSKSFIFEQPDGAPKLDRTG